MRIVRIAAVALFILAPEGRPWLPTGRPAEAHDLEVVVTGV